MNTFNPHTNHLCLSVPCARKPCHRRRVWRNTHWAAKQRHLVVAVVASRSKPSQRQCLRITHTNALHATNLTKASQAWFFTTRRITMTPSINATCVASPSPGRRMSKGTLRQFTQRQNRFRANGAVKISGEIRVLKVKQIVIVTCKFHSQIHWR